LYYSSIIILPKSNTKTPAQPKMIFNWINFRENYHGKSHTDKIGQDVIAKWQHLLELLEAHQQKLERDSDMLSHLRDLETVHATVQSLQKSFDSGKKTNSSITLESSNNGIRVCLKFFAEEFQKAANIDGSMQKLNLYDLEINAIADSIRKFRAQVSIFFLY